MRIGLTSLFLAMTTLAAFGADNSLGTWTLNTGKSTYKPQPLPVKSLTMTREAADGGVKVTVTGERSDGTAVKSSYTAKYDGTETPVTGEGAPYDTISIKQVNANTLTAERKKAGGKYHATDRMVVSKDGKTMTQSSKGTDTNGKPLTVTFHWDKQ